LTSQASQRAAAVAALSQVLTAEKKKSPDTSPSAEAKDEKAFSEVEATEEATEAKEEEEVSPAAEASAEEAKPKQDDSEVETTGVTFTYERLQAKSEKPVTGIDFKRREAYLSEVEFKTVFGMEKESFYKLPGWKQDLLKKKFNLF
jgi:phage protein D